MVDAVLSGDPHLPSRALDVADLVAELAEAAGAVAPDVERDASEPGYSRDASDGAVRRVAEDLDDASGLEARHVASRRRRATAGS